MGSKGIDGYQTWTSQLSTNRASPVNFSSNFEYPFCQITQKKKFYQIQENYFNLYLWESHPQSQKRNSIIVSRFKHEVLNSFNLSLRKFNNQNLVMEKLELATQAGLIGRAMESRPSNRRRVQQSNNIKFITTSITSTETKKMYLYAS